jgi:hypothetical protein
MPAESSAGIPLEVHIMVGRGNLRRAFVVLLALLIVTPHVLLRPCCCAAERVAEAAAVETADLPPCCQKRLQATQSSSAADSSAASLSSDAPGLRHSSRCACRTHIAAVRSGRAQFRALAQRDVFPLMTSDSIAADGTLLLEVTSTTVAQRSFPDWGQPTHLRLCRWLV